MTAFDPLAYLDAASAAIDLQIPAASRDAVAANLARLETLARDVLAWQGDEPSFQLHERRPRDDIVSIEPGDAGSDPSRDDASAAAIAAAVRTGAISALEVIERTLDRIAARNPAINAFTAVVYARARAHAARIDDDRRAGKPLGVLAGVPFGVKAMIDVAGLVTTAGSAIYRDAPAAVRDAEVVRALEAAGAICVGALNMDEFGMGGTTENARFGPTRNPHDVSRTPGGSSGGCAAALASGMVPLAIGSDALGSIRLPASLCGVFGLRPTRGTVSDDGVLGAGKTISTVGPMTRHAADIALCLRAWRGGDASQASQRAATSNRALRFATATGYFSEGLDPDATDAVRAVVEAVGPVRAIDFPQPARARAASTLVNATESAIGRLALLRERAADFDRSTRDRFLAHALLPAQWYLHAQRYRRWHIEQVIALFDDVDVLIVPATPCVAPPIGTPMLRIAGQSIPTGPALGWFTQPLAGTDCPALTVPVADSRRLPIGVQLVAAPHRDNVLLDVAARLEARGVVRAPLARSWNA